MTIERPMPGQKYWFLLIQHLIVSLSLTWKKFDILLIWNCINSESLDTKCAFDAMYQEMLFFKKRMTKFEDPSFSGYAVVRILKALLKLMTAIIIHFSLALKLTSKMFLMLLFWKNTAASLGEMRASCRDVTIAMKKTSHFSLNNF